MGSMASLSAFLKEVATTPVSGLTVNMTALIGPRISSTFPTLVSLSMKMDALKYGIIECVNLHTMSPSQECMTYPTSSTRSGGPSCIGRPKPPRPPPNPPPRPRGPPRPREAPIPRGGRMLALSIAAAILTPYFTLFEQAE